MKTDHLVSLMEYCRHYEIEDSFVLSLQEYGLIEVAVVEEDRYILKDQMQDLEKLIRLHYDLDVNMEGIDVIVHLLHKVKQLQRELTVLNNRLALYENE